MNEIQSIRQDLNRMLDIEELMWHQRIHITWLQKGDRNTTFFTPKHLAGFKGTQFLECKTMKECGRRMEK